MTLGVTVALAGLLVLGVIVLARVLGTGADPAPAANTTPVPPTTPTAPRTGPVALVPVEAPDAGSPVCTALTAALPVELTSGSARLRRLPLAQPAPPAASAWGDGQGDPVVLRCGLSRPPELTATAQLREISGVRWLPVEGERATTWYAVDRPVYVALTVPRGTGTGVLQGVSEVVAASP